MPYLLLILTTLFWSGNFVVSRGMHEEIPPFGLSFWRWVIALIILSFFGLSHLLRQRQLVRKHLMFICIQGLLGVTAFNSLIYLAVQSTTAINAVLVNSCIPVLIAIWSWIMYREVMTPRQCFGVMISFCGVFLIIFRADLAILQALEFNRGDVLVMIAASFWALYSANLKKYPEGLHPLAYLTGIVIAGVLGILPFYCFELAGGHYFQVTLQSVSAIVYVALFASVLAFIFWNRAVRTVGANKAGPFIHLMPVFSTVLAIIFLGEEIQIYHVVGIAIIFTGITMTTYQRKTEIGRSK
ncbi:MAG: DMT family transporter [Desulfocapsaceae bacterium]|nr:DMT family transporter [Desulfocapsaceae bacterium]